MNGEPKKYFTELGPMAWHQPELPAVASDPEPADDKGVLLSLLKKIREGGDGQDTQEN